jgi:hypothetical protein
MKIEIMGSKKLLVGKAAFNNESRPTLHTPHHTPQQHLIVRIWAMAREILQQREKADSCLSLP